MSTEPKSENTQIVSEDTRDQQKTTKKFIDEKKGPKDLKPIFGSRNAAFIGDTFLNMKRTQSQTIVRSEGNSRDLVYATLLGIAPKDELEAMLAVQMSALHNAAMDSFYRANQQKDSSTHSLQARQSHLNTACKLTRVFTQQLEALNRYRGKGQQKMTVEHVHVHSGGQAIVGAINTTKEPQGGKDK